LISWIRGFVLGVLNQTPLSLNDYSLVEIKDAFVGYKINQQINERVSWETARFISFVSLKAAGNKKMKSPNDLMVFDWEKTDTKKGTRGNKWTKQEIEKLKKQKPGWFR